MCLNFTHYVFSLVSPLKRTSIVERNPWFIYAWELNEHQRYHTGIEEQEKGGMEVPWLEN